MKTSEIGTLNGGLTKPNNSWLGREVLFQTGEPLTWDELKKLDHETNEIHRLLDDGDEAGKCGRLN